jgi:hypothetical protein
MSASPNERPAARYCAHCGAALRPAARRQDGSVSDMVNLTRAKDTLLALHEGVRP